MPLGGRRREKEKEGGGGEGRGKRVGGFKFAVGSSGT